MSYLLPIRIQAQIIQGIIIYHAKGEPEPTNGKYRKLVSSYFVFFVINHPSLRPSL